LHFFHNDEKLKKNFYFKKQNFFNKNKYFYFLNIEIQYKLENDNFYISNENLFFYILGHLKKFSEK